MLCCCVGTPQKWYRFPPQIWFGCQDWWHHITLHEGLRFIAQIMRLLEENVDAPNYPQMAWESREMRLTWFFFFLMVVKESILSVLHLVWFELPADAQGESIRASLSAFPDMGQMRRGKNTAYKHTTMKHLKK